MSILNTIRWLKREKSMQKLHKGMLVGIPCTVTEGAFESERLVDIETMEGRVSGFTDSDNVREIEGKMYIKAEVMSVESESLTVRVVGSFFSTNGLAQVPSNQAMQIAA